MDANKSAWVKRITGIVATIIATGIPINHYLTKLLPAPSPNVVAPGTLLASAIGWTLLAQAVILCIVVPPHRSTD